VSENKNVLLTTRKSEVGVLNTTNHSTDIFALQHCCTVM